MAKTVMDQLIRHGEVRRGRIGVSIQDITPDIAHALGLPATRGALVSQVEQNSPAETAGLKPGDSIIELNGQPIRDGNDLRTRVGLRERGTKLTLGVIRKGKKVQISVRVGELRVTELSGANTVPQLAGVKITEIPSQHPSKGEVTGVMAAEVATGSPAWRAGA
jgi:S1-C subfamily serine protease